MGLQSIPAQPAASPRSPVVFHPERCLHALDKSATCTACFELCPVQAIVAGAPPAFDPQKCQSCLACLPVCPTGAYAGEDAVTNLLACAERVEAPVLELVCSRHPNPQMGTSEQATGLLVRGCLAGLGAGALMALAAAGFEKIILRCEACSSCPWGSLRALIQSQAADARALLAHWNKDVVVDLSVLENPLKRPLSKAENKPLSRRDFFRSAIQPKATVEETAAAPRQPGRDRTRKLQAAIALGEPLDPAALLQQSEYAQLSARPSCTACGACARACPTDAIHLAMDENKQRFNLVFYAQNCIHCDACVRACAPGALYVDGLAHLQHVFRTQKPVSLRSGALTRCERCNSLFAAQPDTYLCPLCEFRRTHPFGTRLPPNLKPPLSVKKKTP